MGDDGYPAPLLECPYPPEMLYVAGDPARLRLGLAVIGARKATPYGLTCAREFAAFAASNGVPVISGAACGCDQAAQRAAVEADGTSIAVLGCGADVDYPSSSGSLLRHLRVHGAVVSELPWGHPPMRWAFPARNRIIAALAAAVLVVEAGLPSGTFSTAEHALAANRTVWAVPGSIFSPGSRGPNHLITEGATPITGVEDLAEALRLSGLIDDTSTSRDSLAVEADDPLARALIADPMRPDDAALALSLDVVEVMRRIARLEAVGLVARYPDGRYGARG